MTPLAVGCIFTATTALVLAVGALVLQPRAWLNRAVALTSLLYVLWAAGTALVLSADGAATFWPGLRWGLVGYLLLQPMILAALLEFVGLRNWRGWGLLGLTFILPAIEVVQVWSGRWVIGGYHPGPWGNVLELREEPFWLVVTVLKGVGISGVGMGLLVYGWRNNANRRFRAMVVQLAVLGASTFLLAQVAVSVVWQQWDLPDPTVLLGGLAVATYFVLMYRYQHLAKQVPRLPVDLLKTLPDALVLTDAQGTILETSPLASRLLKASDAQLRGRSVFGVLTGWTNLQALWGGLADGRRRTNEAGTLAGLPFRLELTPTLDGFRDLATVLIRLEAPDAFSESALVDGLTAREREVAGLLVGGLGTQDIADKLSISTTTVRNHLQNLFRKTQTSSRVELVHHLSGARSSTSTR